MAKTEEELRTPNPREFPGEPYADPTDSSVPRSSHEAPGSSQGTPGSSSDVIARPPATEQAEEDYQYMMYMQSIWEDDEWVPSQAASGSAAAPEQSNPLAQQSAVGESTRTKCGYL